MLNRSKAKKERKKLFFLLALFEKATNTEQKKKPREVNCLHRPKCLELETNGEFLLENIKKVSDYFSYLNLHTKVHMFTCP